MGQSDGRRGMVYVTLWTPSLVILMVTLVGMTSGFYYRREYGVVKPDNPYLFVGEDLVLFCNLTKLELLEDSTYLYFTRNGVQIPAADHVEILTTRSVRLRYPIRKPQDEGHFVCWLRQEVGNPRTIGSQHVKADYPVATVKEINCTVYNWENMTCTWDLGQDYHHPEFIRVDLVWTIGGKQKDCPSGHMTNTSCTWVRESPGGDAFLPGHRYIMSLSVTNTRRGKTTRSQTFHIHTDSIVKPLPVSNLHRSKSNATCLWLTWRHSDRVHDKVAFVQYLSQWNSSHWHQLENIFFTKDPGEARICGLTPFTEYTIRVAVKPLPRTMSGVDGYRSEWMYIQAVRTDPSVPDVAPEMCMGCFTDVHCEGAFCRNIIVYWKHIPWALRRSVIHSYHLAYTAQQTLAPLALAPPSAAGEKAAAAGGGGETEAEVEKGAAILSGNVSTLYPNTSQLIPLRNDTAYTVQLSAVTSDHKMSRNHSSLILVAKKDKPRGPGSLIVETEYKADGSWTGHFDLRWSDSGPSTASFLVAWCRGSARVLKCHHEDQNQVQWREVTSSTRDYKLAVSSILGAEKRERPQHYLVGVARQEIRRDGTLLSSGLTWAPCFFLKNSVPSALPENVDFAKVFRAGTLRVTWTYRHCTNTASDVYVTRFIIYYCVITDTDTNNRCKGSEQNTTARRDGTSVLLEDLEQGSYYRVSMAADSQWGMGQRTQPVYSRVLAAQQQEEPRDFTVIGVILAIVIIFVLILIGLCKVRRRLQKNQEKFITSFGDLPSLPPDSAVKSFKDRPLPQVPEGISSSATVVYTSQGAGSTSVAAAGGGAAGGTAGGSGAGGDKRQRGGKHKSITSETSLLGNEDAAGNNDDDIKRRHHHIKSNNSTAGSGTTSERVKLLEDDRSPQDSTGGGLAGVNRYDSDSGADSRYSGDDHDYASVEGGSAEEGGGGGGKKSSEQAGHPKDKVRHGSATTPDEGGGVSHWKLPGYNGYRPAPTHSPPPVPPAPASTSTSILQSAYTPAVLLGDRERQREEVSAASAVSSFRPQGGDGGLLGGMGMGSMMPPAAPMKTFGSLGRPSRGGSAGGGGAGAGSQQHPAQMAVALEPVQTSTFSRGYHNSTLPSHGRLSSGGGGGYSGSEDVTLPRRLPGARMKLPGGVPPPPSGVQDTPFNSAVDPYASTSLSASAFSHIPPPPPAPPSSFQLSEGGGGKKTPTGARGGGGATSMLTNPAHNHHNHHNHNHPHPGPTTPNGTLVPAAPADMASASARPAAEPIYNPPWESSALVPFPVDNRPLSEYMLKLPNNFFDSSLHVNEGPTTEL